MIFFFNDTATTEIYTLSLHDALPISVMRSKSLCEETGKKFPADPYKQLELAIDAVFRSWMGKRAVEYRSEEHTSELQSQSNLVCRLLLEKKKKKKRKNR